MIELLVLALAVTQLLDWYTTRTVLAQGGRELNPVARYGMDAMGVDGFLGIKAAAVTLAGHWVATQAPWVTAAMVIFYAAVVAYNWKSLRKEQG